MDLGAFGVDQELEQADRLQQQALQLLQHAANAHAWSPRSPAVSSVTNAVAVSATWQEPHGHGEARNGSSNGSAIMPPTSDQQAVAATTPTVQELNHLMQTQNGARQVTTATGASALPIVPTSSLSSHAGSGAFIMEAQAQRIRARSKQLGFNSQVDLRPFNATWPLPGVERATGITRPDAPGMPLRQSDLNPPGMTSVEAVPRDVGASLHSQLMAQGAFTAQPHGNRESTLPPASMIWRRHQQSIPLNQLGTASKTHPTTDVPTPPHLQSLHLLVSSRPVPDLPTTHGSSTHTHDLPSSSGPRLDPSEHVPNRFASHCGHAVDISGSPAIPTHPSSCRSAPVNALQILTPTSQDDHPAVHLSAGIASAALPSDCGPTNGPARPSLLHPAHMAVGNATSSSECGTVSGTASCATWRSLDHDSSGAGSWASVALNSAAQDFQELLGMYFGLVAELRSIGIGVLQEASSMRPRLVAESAAKVRAFAETEGAKPEGPGSRERATASREGATAGLLDDAGATHPPPPLRASGTDAVAIDEDPAAAGPRCSHDSAAGAAELAAGLGSLVQQVKTLDLTARQMEVWLAMSTAVNTSTLADADWAEADKSPPGAAPNGNS